MSIHNSQPTILAWQKKTHSTHPVIERLKTMTAELELIQNELCGLLGASDGTARKRSSLPGNAGTDVMRFKAAVDQLRRTLWFYCDADAQEALPTRVQGQLNSLTAQIHPGHTNAEIVDERSGSFFDRLNLVIDGYIQPNGSISRSTRKIKI